MKIVLSMPKECTFAETLQAHGWRHLLPFHFDEASSTLERIERWPDGRVGLLGLRALAPDQVEACLSEEVAEEEVVAKVRRMLQWDVPLDGFHAYCADRPTLAHIPARKQGRLLRGPTLWEDTVKVLCTTNTTWTQTRAMVARMVSHFGSPWPEDPTRHAFPTPAQIAETPCTEFAAAAKLGYRAAAVHDLARAITSGDLDLESWQDPGVEASVLRKRLLALRGIGPYAASCLMLYLGRPEHVNVDSWARTLVSRELGRAVTDREAHAFFEPYGEWRGLVYHFYSWRQGEGE